MAKRRLRKKCTGGYKNKNFRYSPKTLLTRGRHFGIINLPVSKLEYHAEDHHLL